MSGGAGNPFWHVDWNFVGIFNGNFVTTAFDFSDQPITFTATAVWSNPGGSTTLQLMSHTAGTKTGWVVEEPQSPVHHRFH